MKDIAEIDVTSTMDRLCMLAGLLRDEPIQELLDNIERAHAVAPILDPTAYARGMHNLTAQSELLGALLDVQRVVRKMAPDD